MSREIDKYIGKAVIRLLNGDTELFKHYKDKAIELYEKEKDFITVEDLVDIDVKNKLYKMVS